MKYLLNRFSIDTLFDRSKPKKTFLVLANLLKEEREERVGAKIRFNFRQLEPEFILIQGKGKIQSIEVENDLVKICVKGKIITRTHVIVEEIEAEECELTLSLKKEGGDPPYVKPLIKDKDISIYTRDGEIEIED